MHIYVQYTAALLKTRERDAVQWVQPSPRWQCALLQKGYHVLYFLPKCNNLFFLNAVMKEVDELKKSEKLPPSTFKMLSFVHLM